MSQSFKQIDLTKVKAIVEENLSRIRRFETMNNKCCETTSSGPPKKNILTTTLARHKGWLKQMNNRGTQTNFGIFANGDNGIYCMKDTSLEICALFEVDIIKYKKTTRMIWGTV